MSDQKNQKNQNNLKNALGLNKFNFVWIQKVMGISIPIFLVTIDSRYPKIYLSMNSVKKSKTAIINTIKKSVFSLNIKEIKLTPPVLINNTSFNIGSNTLVIVRDVAGDYFHNSKIFEDIAIDIELKNININIMMLEKE